MKNDKENMFLPGKCLSSEMRGDKNRKLVFEVPDGAYAGCFFYIDSGAVSRKTVFGKDGYELPVDCRAIYMLSKPDGSDMCIRGYGLVSVLMSSETIHKANPNVRYALPKDTVAYGGDTKSKDHSK